MSEGAKIVGGCIVLAVLYGWAHDGVTANVAVEYFTIYHPKVIESESPWAMAALWGVIATWWVGAIAGGVLAAAARLGSAPKIGAKTVLRTVAIIEVVLYLLAMAVLATSLAVLPPVVHFGTDYRRGIAADGITHEFSYAGSALAIIGYALWLVVLRRRLPSS